MKQERLEAREGFTEDVKALYGQDARVYGPYRRNSDGRAYVRIFFGEGYTTKQYGKVLLEIKLNRILSKEETLDHIDGDVTNDLESNLQILSRPENTAKSVKKRRRSHVSCVMCSSLFVPSPNQVASKCQSKSGPFCSRSCSGKYSRRVQLTGETRARVVIPVEYFI